MGGAPELPAKNSWPWFPDPFEICFNALFLTGQSGGREIRRPVTQ